MKNATLANFAFVKTLYKPILTTTHKGEQGHVLLIGGSYGKTGAVCMATKAALHSGCGLATAFSPRCGYIPLQITVPEAMVITDNNETEITAINYNFSPAAIAIGMGMGQSNSTINAFADFLQKVKAPLLIDADGLNILSKNKSLQNIIPQKSILTPHKKELERLIGEWGSEDEKIEKVIEFSTTKNAIIVVKGAPTLIIDGAKIYQNTSGNAALATAGSGDVLSGIIGSLLAQQYEPINAAIFGVYIHGLTADLALPDTGKHAFTATTIIRYLGKAFIRFEQNAISTL